MKTRNPIKLFLARLEILSPCCYAWPYSPPGWDRGYCGKCKTRLY